MNQPLPVQDELFLAPCFFEQAEHFLDRLFHLRDFTRPHEKLINVRLVNHQAQRITLDLLDNLLAKPIFTKRTHAGLILHQALLEQMNQLCTIISS